MSSVQTLIVIAIIILLILLLAFMLGLNRRQMNEIEQLEHQISQIEKMHLETAISRLDKMDLAGESLTTLNTWRKCYRQAATQKIPEMQHLLEDAADQNTSYRLFQARKNIKQAQEIMTTTLEDVKNTRDVFRELLESNRENQLQYDSLIKDYHRQRKMILANSFDYGTSLDELENKLSVMEKNFDEAKNLSAQGDHVEAKRVLSQIKINLHHLKQQLPLLKQAHHQLAVIFRDQLREITTTYKKMIADKYYFKGQNILSQVKQVHQLVDQAQDLLAKLQVDELAKQNKIIAQRIDDLYSILAKEIKARPFVEKNQNKMLTLIAHEQTSAQKLVARLRHIDESYELTHGELAKSRHWAQEINEMDEKYNQQTQAIAEGKGTYSEIQDSWLAMLDRLREIDQAQQKMTADVSGLYDSESVARESIKEFKQKVSLIYRRLKRRHLPGDPDSFVQMYTLVINEIGHVSDELQRVRINMEKISQELIQISDDVERLQREADDIINAANLVALTMQYSNKYSEQDNVKRAQSQAMQLYQDEFNYQKALDTIATTLEKVEPGAYQRLENAYYSEKNSD